MRKLKRKHEPKIVTEPTTQWKKYNCTGCDFSYLFLPRKDDSPDMRSIRAFARHLAAYQVYEAENPPAYGVFVGQAARLRGKPVTYWVYHIKDPDLPRCRYWAGDFNYALSLAALRMKGGQPMWLFEYPWVAVKATNRGARVEGTYRTRAAAITKVHDLLDKESQRGYETTIAADIDETVIEAPLTDLTTYIERLINTHLKAKSVSTVNRGLKEIAELKALMVTVDELESELQARMMGGLLDL